MQYIIKFEIEKMKFIRFETNGGVFDWDFNGLFLVYGF